MRNSNPIAAGLQKHGGAGGYYAWMKEQLGPGGTGLLNVEMEWFRAQQLAREPEEWDRMVAAAHRDRRMTVARELSTADLMAILAERNSI